MKILIENNHGFWGGGVETFMPILANELYRKGHSVTVVAYYRHRREIRQWLDSGIRCIRYPFRKPMKEIKWNSARGFADRALKKLYELVPSTFFDHERYDLVVALQEGGVMKRALRERADRRVSWIHTDYSNPYRWKYKPIDPSKCAKELALMSRFERVFCVSQTVRDAIVETVGDPGNLCVRRLPIDVNGIREKAGENCPLSRPKDRPLILSVCRLSAEKQMLMLLEACEMLSGTLDFELWIIGDGPERPKMEAYIAKKGLSFARMLGAQANPFPYMRRADLLVSASMHESYGLSLREALVLGVPVVAVNCRGVRETLDERYGLLTEDSPAALAEGMRVMLQTPGMAEKYRETAARELNAEKLYDERLNAILELLERDPSEASEG